MVEEIHNTMDFPEETFLKIMSYTDHWSFINIRLVSKNWYSFLNPPFNELKNAYEMHITKNSETLIDAAKQSLLIFQAILISQNLLKKLTLDQMVEIASYSYEHAITVFKSRIFIDKPVELVLESISNNTPKHVTSLPEKFDFMKITNKICANIFYHWLSAIDYQGCADKLKRSELLAEDFSYREHGNNATSSRFGHRSSKHHHMPFFNRYPNTPEKLCRNYIARSIAEIDVERLLLVAREAPYVLNKKRLVELARKSPEYAAAILDEKVSKGKLNNDMLEKIKSMSEEHQKIISRYIATLVCFLPINIVSQEPQSTETVALLLINCKPPIFSIVS